MPKYNAKSTQGRKLKKHTEFSFKVEDTMKPDKINPSKVFEGYNKPQPNRKKVNKNRLKKVPKGSHRMPDGSIMKNSDMKKY